MQNFIGFESNLKQAEIVLLGLPYDGTVSFRPGSRFAPNALRSYSYGLESYSPYQDKDLVDYQIADLGDLELPFGNTERVLSIIEDEAKKLLSLNKKILACGGEHLVSYPLLKAHLHKYPNLKIIHLDAHADLREHYLGEKLSHSTVIRLVTEHTNPKNIYQFGIRSGERAEFEWGQRETNFYPFSLEQVPNVSKTIDTETPLYITLDLDVLDPSFFSGTGTPEPGGVSFQELLNALLSFSNHNIVGADVVELAPDYDNSGVSTITAAKLIRELALLMLH